MLKKQQHTTLKQENSTKKFITFNYSDKESHRIANKF